MARRTFFSFHYSGDINRISVVRNSWVTKKDKEDAGFWDAADWEQVRLKTDDVIQRWIDKQLDNTSVTVILIGKETSKRPWVNYEIQKSIERGNGLLGIYIHNIKGLYQQVSEKGQNPLDNYQVRINGRFSYQASSSYKTYDWVYDDGYNNLGSWIENAALIAGR